MSSDGLPGEPRLHEYAYERLCEALMQGEFLPGQQLTFRTLAEALDISVTPVREAVSRLTALGALRVHPKRYIEVERLSAEAYLEMLELRQLLEGHAAARAATRVSEREVREIAKINEALLGYAHKGELRKAISQRPGIQVGDCPDAKWLSAFTSQSTVRRAHIIWSRISSGFGC